jgi:hypothetical protein
VGQEVRGQGRRQGGEGLTEAVVNWKTSDPIPSTKHEIIFEVLALQRMLPGVETQIQEHQYRVRRLVEKRTEIPKRIKQLESILDRDFPGWFEEVMAKGFPPKEGGR